MNSSNQEFWDELLRRLEPDRADLAATEREIEQSPDLGLGKHWIAQRVSEVTGAAVSPPRPRRSRRQQLVALLLLVAVVPAVAWRGARELWPERANSSSTMSQADTIAIVLKPSEDDSARRSALLRALDEATYGIERLRSAERDTCDEVAAAATAALERARVARIRKVCSTRRELAIPWEQVAAVAADPSAPVPARQDAVRRLGDAAESFVASVSAMQCLAGQTELQRAVDLARSRIDDLLRLPH